MKSASAESLVVRIGWAIAVLMSAGCSSHQEAHRALREARQSFAYEGRLIHPALVRHFLPFLSDPGVPVIRTVDVTAASDAGNEYNWSEVTIPGGEEKGLADIYYEYEEEMGPVATPWFGYAFIGSLPGDVQVLRSFDCGGGSMTFQHLVFVQFRLDAQDHLLMDVLALHGIPEPLTDPIVVRGRRVRIPACRHGQDSWDASEVWLEKTAEGYEVRERSLDAEMPGGQPSDSGFRTARALGTTRVANLMEDAKTTGRWYVVVAMGRHAGHLALGIGKAAGATVTLIREEFGVKPATRVPFSRICDIVEAAILKRLASGRRDGVAMLAEGLVELLSEEDQKRVGKPAYGAYGELRMGELDLGWGVKDEMTKRFEERKQELTVVRKDIGCEFRKRYGVIV